MIPLSKCEMQVYYIVCMLNMFPHLWHEHAHTRNSFDNRRQSSAYVLTLQLTRIRVCIQMNCLNDWTLWNSAYPTSITLARLAKWCDLINMILAGVWNETWGDSLTSCGVFNTHSCSQILCLTVIWDMCVIDMTNEEHAVISNKLSKFTYEWTLWTRVLVSQTCPKIDNFNCMSVFFKYSIQDLLSPDEVSLPKACKGQYCLQKICT